MDPRSGRYQPLLAMGTLLLGAVLGGWLGAVGLHDPWAQAVKEGCELAGFLALSFLYAVSIPLIFSSLVLGGIGLEAMRAMPKLAAKAACWIVGGSVVAIVLAGAVAWGFTAWSAPADHRLGSGRTFLVLEAREGNWGMLALVLVSLGFGYYRNQLEEGQGKLFMRFCQSLEGMVTPLVRWARVGGVLAIFFLTVPAIARSTTRQASEHWPLFSDPVCGWVLVLLLAVAALYGLVLSLVCWWFGRVRPWRIVPGLLPAMLLAASSGAVTTALPLTLDALRRLGVSNRVASVIVSLSATLGCDGVALLWAATRFGLYFSGSTGADRLDLVAIGLTAVLLGCCGNVLALRGSLLATLALGLSQSGNEDFFPLLLAGLIVVGGNGLSVFSHACATLVIARSEGEYWVPGPPPDPDELQGLKNDLQLAEG